MRQLFLVLSILLLGLTWSVAQSSAGSSTPSSDQSGSTGQSGSTAGQTGSTGTGQGSDTMGTGQSSKMGNGGHMTVEGCLSGSAGNFTLTDKNGTTYQLTGDTSKLSEHVGHEVKVTGTAGAGAGASGSTETSAGGAGTGSGQSLQVTSVKHVSKSCKSGSGAMSH